MAVSEGAIIPAAVFNSLLGILSRPVAFLSLIFFKRFNTISILGVCREDDLSVVSRYNSGRRDSFFYFIIFIIYLFILAETHKG